MMLSPYGSDVSGDRARLHESHRAMAVAVAVANSVDPDDPALGPCRP